MPSQIDHVIVAAANLETLEGIFTRLGFHVTGGGTHPHLGTRNRMDDAGEGVCAVAVAVGERQTAEDMLRGLGTGYTVFGDTIWIDERATLGVPLALTSAQ